MKAIRSVRKLTADWSLMEAILVVAFIAFAVIGGIGFVATDAGVFDVIPCSL